MEQLQVHVGVSSGGGGLKKRVKQNPQAGRRAGKADLDESVVTN